MADTADKPKDITEALAPLVDPVPRHEASSTPTEPATVPVKRHLRKKPKPRKKNGKSDKLHRKKTAADEGKTQGPPKPPIPRQVSSPKNSHTSPREIKHQEKVAEALEYRRQGHSYPLIAKQMEISQGYAYELVAEGLHNIITEPANEVYTMEMERLNEMFSSMYPAAVGGDVKGIETCLKIMERVDKLVGLERAADLSAARGTSIQNNIVIRLVGVDDGADDHSTTIDVKASGNGSGE